MWLLPMLVTILAVLALVVVLLGMVFSITSVLQRIGGDPDSYLAKLRLGLRAIETETGHLPGSVVALNEELGEIAGGLAVVSGHVKGTIEAAVAQEGGS